MKIKKSSKGFTLIELIVVIAIIGVLAGIAAPSIFSYITSSQQRADQASAKQIQAAASLMYALDSSNTFVDNVSGAVFWGHDKKTKLRYYIHQKLGTGLSSYPTGTPTDNAAGVTIEEEQALIPRPKENSHAFYMYLLPPYTVISLKADNTGNASSNPLYVSGKLDTIVNQNNTYLKERYPQINYAQVITGNTPYITVNQANTVWSAYGAEGTVLSTATVADNGNTKAVGWLNRGIDYGVTQIVDNTFTATAPTTSESP